MEQHILTEDQLIQLGADHGYTVTPWQVQRWRKFDLLPRPRRVPLGKGKGTRSEYPIGAGPQLQRLCQLHQQERRLHVLRFLLWREGFSVPFPAIKATLSTLALRPLRKVQQYSRSRDPFDAAEEMTTRIKPLLGRSQLGRDLLRRLSNPDDVESLLTTILHLFLGGTPSFATDFLEQETCERSLAELMIRGMGMERAQTDHIGDTGPWLPADVSGDFDRLSKEHLLSPKHLARTLTRASEADLMQARNDLDGLIIRLKEFASCIEALFGQGAFGFSSVMGQYFSDDPGLLAYLVLGLLRFRVMGYGPSMDSVEDTLRQALPNLQKAVSPIKL